MITEENILQVVERKIKELFPGNVSEDYKINPEDNLKDSLSLDSLDKVELLMSLEGEYRIVVPYCSEEEWETVQDILNMFFPLVNNK